MNTPKEIFPPTEDGNPVRDFPEAMTVETVDMLEQASALAFRALRQNAQRMRAEGLIEYESWLAG
jgi:uncharacterized protein YbjQ (UPF0145 family)